jgi:diguanylate cyclase (GGDEF)-like protein
LSRERVAPKAEPSHAPAPAVGDTPATARQQLRSLVQLARMMAEPRATEDLVEVAAHEIRFALGAGTVSVSRFERERGLIRVLCNVGELGPGEEFRPVDETYRLTDSPLLTQLIEDAAPYTHSTAQSDPEAHEVALLTRLGKTYSMGSPILVDGRVWGELYLTRGADGRPFDEDDVALVEALAAVMASGVAQSSRVSLVERLAYEDPLTGLANRRAIDLRLEEALDARNSGGLPVSVVMADVNGLKRMNDERGHEAGDRVLASVADAIAISVGQVPAGLAGRIGGDEFCIVLDGLDSDDALRVAQSVIDRLAEGPYAGALSCGVASTSLVGPGDPVTGRQLLRWADEAQYSAKRARMRTPVLAGRDTLLVEPTERRTLRAGQPDQVRGTAGTSSTGGDLVHEALTAGLAALATAGTDAQLRLVRVLDQLCDALGAEGWVLSRIADGRTTTAAFAQSGETARPEVQISLTDDWIERARLTGVLDGPGRADESGTLTAPRCVAVVAAAVVGEWLLELLAGEGVVLDGAPELMRALGGVAVHG